MNKIIIFLFAIILISLLVTELTYSQHIWVNPGRRDMRRPSGTDGGTGGQVITMLNGTPENCDLTRDRICVSKFIEFDKHDDDGTTPKNLMSELSPEAVHSRTFCFLAEYSADDIDNYGEKAKCKVTKTSDSWVGEAYLENDGDSDVDCGARCIYWNSDVNIVTDNQVTLEAADRKTLRSNPQNVFCALTENTFSNVGDKYQYAMCEVTKGSDGWFLGGSEGRNDIEQSAYAACGATCISWDQDDEISLYSKSLDATQRKSGSAASSEKLSTSRSVCAISKIAFEDIDGSDEWGKCWIGINENRWESVAQITKDDDADVFCNGVCIQWQGSDVSPVTCNDGQQNGDETGVDCGGSSCPACQGGGTPVSECVPGVTVCSVPGESCQKVPSTNSQDIGLVDFETSPNFVATNFQGSDAIATTTTNEKSSGASSLQIDKINSEGYSVIGLAFNVQSNQDYRIEGWMKTNAENFAKIYTVATSNFDQSGSIGASEFHSGDNTWEKVLYEFNSGDKNIIYILLQVADNSGSAFFDDIKISRKGFFCAPNCEFFNTVLINPVNCPASGCRVNDKVSITANYRGSCPLVPLIQVDAKSSDNSCTVKNSGGSVTGMSVACTSRNTNQKTGYTECKAEWTIPEIPSVCSAKTVNAYAAAIWKDQIGPASNYIRGGTALNPIKFTDISQLPTCSEAGGVLCLEGQVCSDEREASDATSTRPCCSSANLCTTPSGVQCGNGIKDGTEQCDGTDLGTITSCSQIDQAFSGGVPTCKSDCTLDISACMANCNDDICYPNEPASCGGASTDCPAQFTNVNAVIDGEGVRFSGEIATQLSSFVVCSGSSTRQQCEAEYNANTCGIGKACICSSSINSFCNTVCQNTDGTFYLLGKTLFGVPIKTIISETENYACPRIDTATLTAYENYFFQLHRVIAQSTALSTMAYDDNVDPPGREFWQEKINTLTFMLSKAENRYLALYQLSRLEGRTISQVNLQIEAARADALEIEGPLGIILNQIRPYFG